MTQSETTRLAQELHDGIAQDLVALGYSLDLVLANSSTPLETRSEIRKVRLSISELLERTRMEIHDLHQLEGSDLFLHIRRLSEDLLSYYIVEIDFPETFVSIPEPTIFQVLRIVREAFRNIIEHACASEIKISAIPAGDSLLISILDNGAGQSQSEGESFGLIGATKRAAAMGGSLSCTRTTEGFSVTLTFPIFTNEN